MAAILIVPSSSMSILHLVCFDDLADHLAAGADDFADLLLRHVDHGDARRGLRHVAAVAGQRLGHLAQDVQAAVPGLLQRDLHDLRRDGRDLDVHLQGGDADLGAGHLEVHVAEVVLVAQDVGQDREALVFLDQAHGDARHRPLQRHAGIHQRQRGAADGRHRGRAVGLGDLRHDAHGVGELVLRRQQRMDGAPGQLAVADFAPARRSHAARFTDRVGREVVVQHEVLAVLAFQRVDDLLVLAGAQGRDAERLRLAAGEQRGAMGARQDMRPRR